MNTMIIKKITFALCALFTCAISLNAHTIKIRSIKQFYKMIEKPRHPYIVALLYTQCGNCCNDQRSIDSLLGMVSSVSSAWLYKGADVQFLKVNVDKDCLEELQQDFQIGALPTFLLFKYGTPVNDQSGAIAQLTGFVSSDELRQFIDEYLQSDLQDRVEQKAEDRERRAAAAAYYWYNTPGCSYPWYGAGSCGWYGGGCGYGGYGGYGRCGGYGGCGVSFGFGCCR